MKEVGLCSRLDTGTCVPGLAQQALVGTYKIVYQVHELRGAANETVSESRHGYLVLTTTRAIAFYAVEKGLLSTSVAERADAFEGLSGWAGVYRVEGNRLVISRGHVMG